jgi:UDP-N-acetylmuramate dehydrogenase
MIKTKTIDFSKYSSIKIGQKVEVTLLEKGSDYDDSYFLIGGANNLLLSPNPPKLMMLSKKYDYIKIEDNLLKIGGATPSGKVASFCKKHNIADFEFLSHLPGKMGGLVFMNAGLKEYEVFNSLIDVTTTQTTFKKEDIKYGYRTTDINKPILEASFKLKEGFNPHKVELFKKMRSNQPNLSSAGSCFKNPQGDYAGRLIELIGLKGCRVGAMEFSSIHANFLVNHGGGTYKDAIYLIKEVQKRVLEKVGIKLELEIQIL